MLIQKRPDIETLEDKIGEMRRVSYQNEEQQINNNTNMNNSQFNIENSSSINTFFEGFSSRVYNFKNLPQPRNATKGNILIKIILILNIKIISHIFLFQLQEN